MTDIANGIQIYTCTQLDFKKSKVQDCLIKIGKIDYKVDEIVRLNDFNYRNKMVFPVRFINGKTVIGMFKKESHDVVDISNCLISEDKIVQAFNIIKDFLLTNNYKGFNQKKFNGRC